MVLNNTLTAIGDVLIIDAVLSRNGIYNIEQYTANITGLTITRLVKIELAISVNSGNSFGSYVELLNDTDAALVDHTVTGLNKLVYRFRFTRIGTDATDEITVNDIRLFGTLEIIKNNKILIHKISVSGVAIGLF